MPTETFKDRLFDVLETCSERRVATWQKKRGVGIDSVNAAWVEDVFWGKSWREVRIPESDVLSEWFLYLPVSELPKMFPAILKRCCGDEENEYAPVKLLEFNSRHYANPGGWDPVVLQCLIAYVQEFADESDQVQIVQWLGIRQ